MLRAEFTIEPFVTGDRGAHGRAALAVVTGTAVLVDDGPFGTTLEGDDEQVLSTLADALRAAFGAGATRVSLQVARPDDA